MGKIVLFNMCKIINSDGQVLVQNRVKPGWTGISFPGGHIEECENIEQSTIREVYEETGLKISSIKLIGIKEWSTKDTKYIVFLFETQDFSGKLINDSDEGHNYWIYPNDIYGLKTTPDFLTVLDIYLNKNKDFTFNKKINDQIVYYYSIKNL